MFSNFYITHEKINVNVYYEVIFTLVYEQPFVKFRTTYYYYLNLSDFAVEKLLKEFVEFTLKYWYEPSMMYFVIMHSLEIYRDNPFFLLNFGRNKLSDFYHHFRKCIEVDFLFISYILLMLSDMMSGMKGI